MTATPGKPHVKFKKRYYTPADIAKLTGRSRQAIVAAINRGELEAERTSGGHWRIKADNVEGVEHVNRVPVTAEV